MLWHSGKAHGQCLREHIAAPVDGGLGLCGCREATGHERLLGATRGLII
jgi:hypothetical protein